MLGDQRTELDVPVQYLHPVERNVVERLHEGPVEDLVDLDEGHHPLLDARVEVGAALQLDPEPRAVAEPLEDFLERLELLTAEPRPVPASRVQALELPHGARSHRT